MAANQINSVNPLEGMSQSPLRYQTVAAAGTVVGNAGALIVGYNRITAGDGTTGVVLPAATGNGPVYGSNCSASNLKVYAPSGAAVADGTVDAAVTVAARKGFVAFPFPNGNWGIVQD